MREYDAHIYFTKESENSAKILRQRMLEAFPPESIWIGQLIHRTVGPHPLPMFEVNFRKEALSKVVLWLEKNRNQHIVLLHPVTGNDLADHTISAQWLGEPLRLNTGAFDTR